MSKYTEALNKIEQNRMKGEPIYIGKQSSPRSSFRGYAFGVVILSILVLLAVYGYGVWKGSGSLKPYSSPKPVNEAVEAAKSEDQTMLLQNLEKMIQVAPAAEIEKPNALPAPLTTSFYTIQLDTFETEAIAKEKAREIRAEGYSPFILRGNQEFKLCIEKFPNQLAADTQLVQIKDQLGPDYDGAFVKYVKIRAKPVV